MMHLSCWFWCTIRYFVKTEYILGWVELKLELKSAWNDLHALFVRYVSTNAHAHTSGGKISSSPTCVST
jgi:hypothetical protein